MENHEQSCGAVLIQALPLDCRFIGRVSNFFRLLFSLLSSALPLSMNIVVSIRGNLFSSFFHKLNFTQLSFQWPPIRLSFFPISLRHVTNNDSNIFRQKIYSALSLTHTTKRLLRKC